MTWAYTVWCKRDEHPYKWYYDTSMTKDELKAHIESKGYTDVLVWAGNWFGLAPDNTPEPDYIYFGLGGHRSI